MKSEKFRKVLYFSFFTFHLSFFTAKQLVFATIAGFALAAVQTNERFAVFVLFRAKFVGFALESVIAFLVARRRAAVLVAPEIFARDERDLAAADLILAAFVVKKRRRA